MNVLVDENKEDIGENILIQKELLLKLNQILFKDVKKSATFLSEITFNYIEETKEGKISIKEGAEFIKANKDDIFRYNLVELEEYFKKDKNNHKDILKLLSDSNFLKCIDIIKEKINSEKLSIKVTEIVKGYESRINDIISQVDELTSINKLIKKGNTDLQSQVIELSDKLEPIKNILELYGINSNEQLSDTLRNGLNLLDIIPILEERNTFKKGDNIVATIKKLQDSHEAYEAFIKKLTNNNILIKINNSKGLLPVINSTALNAVNKEKIITKELVIEKSFSSFSKTEIIKAGTQKVEKYNFSNMDDIKEKTEEKNIDKMNIFEEMLQHIKELEIKNNNLSEELQEKRELEKNTDKLKKEYQNEINKLKKELAEKNTLILKNNIIVSKLKK